MGKNICQKNQYPVDSFYFTRNASSRPAKLFGGTWEQLSADAYLKIVTSGGGTLGGTASNHKIPIESVPSHNHSQTANNANYQYTNVYKQLGQTGNLTGAYYTGDYITDGTDNMLTNAAGGGQAYYPYYYGIIAWVRTA